MIGKTNILGSINKGGFWLDGWKYGKKITVPKSKVDAELTNFPLTVYLNDTNFDFTKAEADGKDIRFTDGELNHLTFERKEHIAGTTKSAVYNVKVPTVSNIEDTEIYMWYGNASATDTANTTGDVWDDNYVMVQHMGDSLVDATGNGNNGTATGTTVVNTDYGKARSFNGTSDKIDIPDSSFFNMSQYTIVTMAKFDTFPSFGGIQMSFLVSRKIADTDVGAYNLQAYQGKFGNALVTTTGGKGVGDTTPLTTAEDYALAGKWTGSEIMAYKNGVSVTTPVSTTGTLPDVSDVFRIGARHTTSFQYYTDGTIYTARISNIARSDAWIKAESLALKNELITQADL